MSENPLVSNSAEAFTLVARLREWRHPVIVHPQFTEPQSALERAGHRVTEVHLAAPTFELDEAAVTDPACVGAGRGPLDLRVPHHRPEADGAAAGGAARRTASAAR